MYVHIAWLYAALIVGSLVGLLVAGLCAAADGGNNIYEGGTDDTK